MPNCCCSGAANRIGPSGAGIHVMNEPTISGWQTISPLCVSIEIRDAVCHMYLLATNHKNGTSIDCIPIKPALFIEMFHASHVIIDY